MDFEDKDPFSWSDEKTPLTNKPTLVIYWDDTPAEYRYRLDTNNTFFTGDATWAVRIAKHYNILMPKVEATPVVKKRTLGKKPLGGKK